MLDEALDPFGEIGHGLRGGATPASAFDGLGKPRDRGGELGRDAGRGRHEARHGALREADGRALLDREGREVVLQFGEEPALRLARLQVEKADDERGAQPEQRGREGDADAGERRGEARLQLVEQHRGIPTGAQGGDARAHRAHGLDQAPKRAEQAEQDE